MRKLIVLLMAVVLPTGTVANAEEDASQLINIVGISELGSSIDPSPYDVLIGPGGQEIYGTGEYSGHVAPYYTRASGFFHKMTIEIKKEDGLGVLDQAAICFFDSNVLTNQSQRETTCGNGIDAQGSGLSLSGPRTGLSKPQSAVQIGFIPSIGATSFTTPIANIDPDIGTEDENPNHNVRPANSSGSNISKVTLTDQFNGVTGDSDSVYKVEIFFRPSEMAKNTSGWKIRVVPKYLNPADDTIKQYEFVSSQSYTVRQSSGLEIDSRGQVEYGTGTAGGAVERKNISTAVFQANSNVDITLTPTKFTSDGVSVDFGTASNQIRMACGPDQNNLQDFIGDQSNKLFANIEGNSEPDVNAREYKIAPTHDCTLFIGSDVPPGSYSNVITLAVRAAVR